MMLPPLRTLLFIPANRERFYEKAGQVGADGVVVDLEDGLPEAQKDAGRAMARERIAALGGGTWVRVNGAASGALKADLEALVGVPGVVGVVLPKVRGPQEIVGLEARLDELETARLLDEHSIGIIPMLETARGVQFAFEIATASDRVASVCFGGARGGDLQADLGSGWSIEGPELLFARQRVLLAARAAGIGWPLDGVFGDVGDPEGFARDTDLSRRLGYRGRTVIHPEQVAVANRLYLPSPDETNRARRLIEAFAAAEADGRATTLVDGQMIDYAMVRHARAVLAQTEAGAPTAALDSAP